MIMSLRCCILYVILLSIQDISFGQESRLQKEIEKIIRHETSIDFDLVPGILVGVMDGDSTYICSYGQVMSPDSIYELGSVTKPFVAWLVKQALDSLAWPSDASLCQFLPDSICHAELEHVTMAHALTHRTGYPRLPPDIGLVETNIQDPFMNYTHSLLATDLQGLKPNPGEYMFSHIGFALMYWLFEKVGGMEAFTNDKFLVEHQLSNTTWDMPDQLIAIGHGKDGRRQPPWHTSALSPAIGLKSNLNDIMSFLNIVMAEDLQQDIPSARALKKEMKVSGKKTAYAFMNGWFLVPSGSHVIFYHNGQTGGHHVSVAFRPEERKGVVVIANGSVGTRDLSLLILDMVTRAGKY